MHKLDHLNLRLEQALVLHQTGRFDEAQSLYEQILSVQPRHFDALHLLGVLASNRNSPRRALELIDKALAVDSSNAVAHFNRGTVLQALQQWRAALASYDRAIDIDPNLAEAYCNRGVVQTELKDWAGALASCGRAIDLRRDFAAAYYNRGNVCREMRQWAAALADYDQAIGLNRDYAEALFNRGNVLAELAEWDAALTSYDRALAVKPDYAIAYANRGNVCRELGRWEAALASYRQANSLKPDLEFLRGQLVHTRMRMCDWLGMAEEIAVLTASIERGEPAASPFAVLAYSGSAALQKKAAQIWTREKCPPARSLPAIHPHPKHEKIRIGYFSADFHDHATSYLIGELLEMHDRSLFEVTAFSFGPNRPSAMKARLMAACHEFVDVSDRTDSQVAALARSLEIDIAVDLKGHTEGNRAGIFALRAAPLQVNYLGYPGTMGASYIDYLLADRTLVPDESQQHYVEKIVYLPDSYQPNDAKRSMSPKVFTRTEAGLPQDGFVFCCFNNNYKIMPDTFDRWMRILTRVGGSVLWLLEDNAAAASNLRREALRRNVDADRLVFAKRMDLPEHLARQRTADLFLDTWPCNAHTTASDALWAGLPLLTCAGESFASRVAASLLAATRLPELIASTPGEYEDLAVALATDPRRLAEIKQKLAESRLTVPLFDSARYAKHLEEAYRMMYEHHRANLPAQSIYPGRARSTY